MTPAIRYRDLQQRLVILVACHVALATVISFEVLTDHDPLSLSPLALVYAAIAISGLVIMVGVSKGASWSRIPLLILCLVSLPSCPLSFFALGILLLLVTGPLPRLLTADFQRQLALEPSRKYGLRYMWLWLAGTVFIYLAVWIFLQP
jgi:hypothetical protein